MCIYCGTLKYRKIYEQHHGVIPTDINGRTYEIHHIDGDRKNNDPSNLKAMTIQAHYDIHHQQGDYGACIKILTNMTVSPETRSELARKQALERVKNGTHPFSKNLNGDSFTSKRVSTSGYVSNLAKRDDGTSVSKDRVLNGSHHLLKRGPSHPTYDHTVYCFENITTGEIVRATQREFIINNGGSAGCLSELVNGKRKTHKGWKIRSGDLEADR